MQSLHHGQFYLDTVKDSVGGFEWSWQYVLLATDTSNTQTSAPCVGAQNDQKS